MSNRTGKPGLCSIITPRQDGMLGVPNADSGYLAECILLDCHDGPHVFKTPGGKYFAWEDDWSCDCCKPDEEDRCTIYWEIKEEEIVNLSKGQVP